MFILAQVYETEGSFKESASLYEKVFVDSIPDEFCEKVLIVYEMADRFDKVYEILNVKYKKQSDDVDLCERLAHTCCILKKYDEAVALYNTILEKQPENIVALKQLADIYENTNQMMFHLTNARLAQLEENMEKAEKEYKKAFSMAEKDDDIIQIRYQMAKLYRSIGKNEQALDEYIYILSATEENFSVFIELAEIYIELNNTASAINVLKRALHIYPDNVEAMQMLADTYSETGEYDKAENYLERLVAVDGKNIENKVSLAKVYLQMDKLEKTYEILAEAERLDNNSTDVLTAMAGYYTYVSDFEKAKTYCNRIIQKVPNSPLGYRKLAQLYEAMGEKHLSHFNYGIYHEMHNEIADAINEYNCALQIKKDDFEIIKRLACLHENLNEYDIAADYYHMLFEANIDLCSVTKKLANIYMDRHEFDIAQKYIEAAINKENNIEFSFLNAKCMYKLKDFEGATEALNYYKENTKSLENLDGVDKLLSEIEQKKETSNNPFSWLFKFLDK